MYVVPWRILSNNIIVAPELDMGGDDIGSHGVILLEAEFQWCFPEGTHFFLDPVKEAGGPLNRVELDDNLIVLVGGGGDNVDVALVTALARSRLNVFLVKDFWHAEPFNVLNAVKAKTRVQPRAMFAIHFSIIGHVFVVTLYARAFAHQETRLIASSSFIYLGSFTKIVRAIFLPFLPSMVRTSSICALRICPMPTSLLSISFSRVVDESTGIMIVRNPWSLAGSDGS